MAEVFVLTARQRRAGFRAWVAGDVAVLTHTPTARRWVYPTAHVRVVAVRADVDRLLADKETAPNCTY